MTSYYLNLSISMISHGGTERPQQSPNKYRKDGENYDCSPVYNNCYKTEYIKEGNGSIEANLHVYITTTLSNLSKCFTGYNFIV